MEAIKFKFSVFGGDRVIFPCSSQFRSCTVPYDIPGLLIITEVLVDSWQKPVTVHFNLPPFEPQKYVAICGHAIMFI